MGVVNPLHHVSDKLFWPLFFFSKTYATKFKNFFKPTLKSRIFREFCHKMISVVWIDAFFFFAEAPSSVEVSPKLEAFLLLRSSSSRCRCCSGWASAANSPTNAPPEQVLLWRHRVKLSSVLQRFCCNSGNTRPGLLKAELLEAQPARREIDYYVQNIIASQRDMTKPGP